MPNRRCVICGQEPPEKDAKGKEAYAYPKNDEEARVWQASMGAKGCCVESIQHQCCVCVQHIPDFVKRAKKIGRRMRSLEQRRLELLAEAGPGCECPDGEQGGPGRPSVNVLLLNGASLPTYCGKGQSCVDLRQLPDEDGDSALKVTKRVTPKDSDTEIFVQESGFRDTGGVFPDIDGTEVTLMRTPLQEDEKLEQQKKELLEAEQEPDEDARRRRTVCQPGCTDVLLLARGHHDTDDCPCKCEQCTKPDQPDDKGSPCDPPCCPESQPEYRTQPPCGCECEQQVRRELGKVIKEQSKRIKELEQTLCRQNSHRVCLQRKLDELYCEFGRLEKVDGDGESRLQLKCPDSDRVAPDCSSVLRPPPEPQPQAVELPLTEKHPRRRKSIRLALKKSSSSLVHKPKKETPAPEPGQRVHWFAERSADSDLRTVRPEWVTTAYEEHTGSRTAIRLGDPSSSSRMGTSSTQSILSRTRL